MHSEWEQTWQEKTRWNKIVFRRCCVKVGKDLFQYWKRKKKQNKTKQNKKQKKQKKNKKKQTNKQTKKNLLRIGVSGFEFKYLYVLDMFWWRTNWCVLGSVQSILTACAELGHRGLHVKLISIFINT